MLRRYKRKGVKIMYSNNLARAQQTGVPELLSVENKQLLGL